MLQLDHDGPVTVVTIDRPEARNAVDGPTADALAEAFRAFDADPDSSVAVLTGAGSHFCAGADLKAIAEAGGLAVGQADLEAVAEAGGADAATGTAAAMGGAGGRANRLEAPPADAPLGVSRLLLHKPVIAAVEGYAVAGGLELALWCDLRVTARSAVFGVFCRRWGVPLVDMGTIRLPRLIGESRAMDLILTGRAVTAEEALAIGLANRLVADGEARAAAVALAHEIAAFPQTCVRADHRTARDQWDLGRDEALDREFARGRAVLTSGEAAEGAERFTGGAGRHGQPA